MWQQILFILLAVAMIFFAWRLVKRSPGSFTMSNFHKSASTFGVLAVILIAFIGLLVLFLKH